MVATLAKNGTGYSLNNRRSFGAWGEIRQGATSGAPKGRYCANLGHLDDDESGLTYMRARYYESGSGRFISQDHKCSGRNWFTYVSNLPTMCVDASGEEGSWDAASALTLIGGGFLALALIIAKYAYNPSMLSAALGYAALGVAFTAIGAVGATSKSSLNLVAGLIAGTISVALLFTAKEILIMGSIIGSVGRELNTAAQGAVIGCYLYSMSILCLLKEMEIEESMMHIGGDLVMHGGLNP